MAHTPLFHRLQAAVRQVSWASRPPAAGSRPPVSRAGLNRRAFLGLGGAAAAGWLGRPGPVFAMPGGPAPAVAVVGAGLAGLTCAYRLRQAGLAATVYEANTRLGGRCWTRRGDFADAQLAEQGGEFIDQGHTTIRQLAQELGLDLDNLLTASPNGTGAFFHFDGAPYPETQVIDDLKRIWQKLHRDLSEAGYPTLYYQSTERGRQLDRMSILDWIEETVPGGTGSRLGQLLDVAYTIEYGAESGDQSALNLLYLLGYSGQGQLRIFGPSNEKYRVRGGNDQIVQRLAAALPGQVQAGASLSRVALNPDGRFTLGLGTRSVTVDKVVLALPFSILRTAVDCRRAGFSPLKQLAIAEQGMGANAKLHVQFTNRHWEALGGNGDSYADTGYQATWDVSRAQPGRSGILVDYTGGHVALSFRSGTVAGRTRQFLSQIEPVYPGLTAQGNGRATLDYWPGNPFSRGSYSYWRVGQYTRFAGVEREQSGNCHFAGEHTSVDAQGYLEGAVESGERAAREVLDDLGYR